MRGQRFPGVTCGFHRKETRRMYLLNCGGDEIPWRAGFGPSCVGWRTQCKKHLDDVISNYFHLPCSSLWTGNML